MESECSGVFLLAAGEVNQHQRWTKLSQRDGLESLGLWSCGWVNMRVSTVVYMNEQEFVLININHVNYSLKV